MSMIRRVKAKRVHLGTLSRNLLSKATRMSHGVNMPHHRRPASLLFLKKKIYFIFMFKIR